MRYDHYCMFFSRDVNSRSGDTVYDLDGNAPPGADVVCPYPPCRKEAPMIRILIVLFLSVSVFVLSLLRAARASDG